MTENRFERVLKVRNIQIGDYVLGTGRVFVIAETGSNHKGNIEEAKKLVDAASWAGANAITFRCNKFSELYDDLSNVKNIPEFDESWYKILDDYCTERKIIFLPTPEYFESVDICEEIGITSYKISSQFTYGWPQLIEKIALCGKPTFMATGYCDLKETDRAISFFAGRNPDLAVLHAVEEYPVMDNLACINQVQTFQALYSLPSGFEDNTIGYSITLACVGLGADIVTKHIQLGSGYGLSPSVFKDMVKSIRRIENAKGNIEIKISPSRSETKIRNNFLMYTTDGEKFRRDTKGIDAWKYLLEKKVEVTW